MPFDLRANPFPTGLAAALILAVLSPSLAASAAASEMIRLEIEFFENGSTAPVNHATVWTSERRIRVEQRAPGERTTRSAFIYRGDEELILSLSERARTYSKLERQLLTRLGNETKGPRREVEAQLQGLPSDQRRAFERLLGVSRQDPDMASDPVVVTRVGRRGSVAGFECEQVVLRRSTLDVGQACVASWEQVGMRQADVEVFRELANFQRDVMGSRALTPMELVPDQPLDLVLQFGGLPLSFERSVRGRARSAIRVVSVESVPADDGLFEAPADYALRSGYGAILSHFAAARSVPPSPSALPAADAREASAGPGSSPAASPPAAPAPADERARVQSRRTAQAPSDEEAKRVRRLPPASSMRRRPETVRIQLYPGQ